MTRIIVAKIKKDSKVRAAYMIGEKINQRNLN